jgi:hypothetical protein
MVMDDPKENPEMAGLPLQGPHWQNHPKTEGTTPFLPLRLILFPGGWGTALNKPEVVVGRHSSADLRLPLPDVSRLHCRFAFANGSWHVFDLSSLNGVFVNNERVEQALLHHLDLIRIGSYTFQVYLEGVSATSAVPSIDLKTQEKSAGPLPEPEAFSQRKAS